MILYKEIQKRCSFLFYTWINILTEYRLIYSSKNTFKCAFSLLCSEYIR